MPSRISPGNINLSLKKEKVMVFRLCSSLLAGIGRYMLFALLIAAIGAIFLLLGLFFGAVALLSSSPTLGALVAAILAHPFFGKVVMFGLLLFVVGLLSAFAMIVLYVLASAVCCSLAADATGANKTDLCDCRALCLLGPLFPAATFLILVLVITPVLFLGVRGWDLGVTPNELLTVAAFMLGLFGLLLALAPVIWCCCKACKCKENDSGGGVILAQAPLAFAVDPSEGPH